MDGHEVLREAAALIRSGWCHGADARDRSGQAVDAVDPTATAWSLVGALAVVSERPGADLGALTDALWGISGVIPDVSLDDWNDRPGRSQADTLHLLASAESSLTRDPRPPTYAAPC